MEAMRRPVRFLKSPPEGRAYGYGRRRRRSWAPGSVFRLDSQGSVVASSTAVPGSVDDLHLDSSGNAIAIGSTQSGSLCGPDRPNLGLLAVFVIRFDSHLAGISSSAVIPQQLFIGRRSTGQPIDPP
jgi:hypothetical protein